MVRSHLCVAAAQATLPVAAVLLERVSDAKDRRDPTPHTGQAAAHFQKVPLLGLVSSSLTEVVLSKMAPSDSTARPCQGLEDFQVLHGLQTVGWRELVFANTRPSQEVSRCHARERVQCSLLVWDHLCCFRDELPCVSHIQGAALAKGDPRALWYFYKSPWYCYKEQQAGSLLAGRFGDQPPIRALALICSMLLSLEVFETHLDKLLCHLV